MAQLVIPADMAVNLANALEYWGRTPAAAEFRALVAAGTPWSPARPRQLIAWGTRRRVLVMDGERMLLTALTGFRDAGRRQRLRAAMLELREAAERVADGRERRMSLVEEGVFSLSDDRPAERSYGWGGGGGDEADRYGGRVREGSAAEVAAWRLARAASDAAAAARGA